VLIKDHHDGYITWAGYLANEAKLAANRTNAGGRPPREGRALCQGIIACGSCGKPMRTNYHTGQRPSYECSSRADRLTTPMCRSVAAATVDDAVAAALPDALTPEQVALALSAADQVSDRHQRVSRAAELAVERARYEADRAERAFCAVEPENRLVARSLEARWETRLAALAEAGQALEAARDSLPPPPSRADLEKLAADLPALWHAPTTSSKDRKRLLRTLIADITLLPEPAPGKARIGIRWHAGATDELTVARAVHPGTARRSPSPAVEMVRELGPATPTAELAEQLNAAGLTTGNGRPFDVKAVQWIRHACQIPAPAAGLLFQGGQELAAGLLAAPAGLPADPAVLVHPGVPLALVAAAFADGHAGLQQRPGDVGVVGRLSACHSDGGGADIGAVQAQPDARDHLGQVLRAQVGVDVGDAGLRAVAERVDGGGQHTGVDVDGAGVAVQQLPGVAHGPSL
jgi:hypothetical protein